jgi:hypothetical protein
MANFNVLFQINHKNYPYRFDRTRLNLGAKIFVELDNEDNPKDFYSDFRASCIPYWVMWITQSGWQVILQNKYDLDTSLQSRIVKAVETYLDQETVVHGLSIVLEHIRPDHMFKNSEFDNSELAVIYTVVERLDLCSKLTDTATAKQLWYHYRPLMVYLLLTCFDRLGQPADWMDFGGWLRNGDKQHERMQVILEKAENYDEIATAFYDTYNKIYGVRNSFYRFLHQVLPQELREELLGSIRIDITDLPPNSGKIRTENENAKEKFLFQLRNDYTHKAQFIPGLTNDLWPEEARAKAQDAWEVSQQFIEQSSWKCVYIRNWPEILEKVVKVGLAMYIQKIITSAQSRT